MDAFAAESHKRALAGHEAGHFAESNRSSTPGATWPGTTMVCGPTRPRSDSQKLKPVFDRTYGNVTAGNSSQVTDGAAMLILASEGR